MSRRYVVSKAAPQPQCFADVATAERWQHSRREMVVLENGRLLAVRAQDECMLDRWLGAGAISADEHTSGLKLRGDYHQGRVPVMAHQMYSGIRSTTLSGWESPAESRSAEAESAYRRWRAAIRAVGQRHAALLIAVCCEDGALAWTRRGELRSALQQLEHHYAH